ncbi:MAG: hypothetical protein ABMA64_41135, partial [Myxococcota bacterium]
AFNASALWRRRRADSSTGNAADDYGGGMSTVVGSLASLGVRDATFEANHAEDSGGGLFTSGGPTTLTGLVLTDNTSEWGGGTSLNWGEIWVVGAVYERNVATLGSASDLWDADVVLQDTLVADHTGGVGAFLVYSDAGPATLVGAGATFLGNTPADVVVQWASGESSGWSGLGADFSCSTDALACE